MFVVKNRNATTGGTEVVLENATTDSIIYKLALTCKRIRTLVMVWEPIAPPRTKDAEQKTCNKQLHQRNYRKARLIESVLFAQIGAWAVVVRWKL